MPKFTIVEVVREERDVGADTAQDALDRWLTHGDSAVTGRAYVEVTERYVLDAAGNVCEVEDQ